MKNLVYILLVSLTCIGCSEKKDEPYKGYTVVVAPDSVWDYSYLDSIDQHIRAYSYDIYGDSDIWGKDGLPDSMKLHNN